MRALRISKQITNRDGQSLDKYLQEIAKVDLLTIDEEAALTARVRAGDQLALEKLTQANLRFVVSVAKKYQHYGIPLCDLINEGNVGLIRAGKKFDASRGFRFLSYAVWWIRQSILTAVASQSRVVRLPVSQTRLGSRISKTLSDLEQKLEREPTLNELANMLDIPEDEIAQTIHAARPIVSVFTACVKTDDGERCWLDVLENNSEKTPDSTLLADSLRGEIQRVLHTLSQRQANVIEMYFGIGSPNALTLDEIAAKMSLTRERVRQIKDKAIQRLRYTSRSKTLKYYMG